MKLLEVWRMHWCCVLQTAFREWSPMLGCFQNARKTWQTKRQLMQLLPNIMFEVMPSQQKFTSFCLKLLSPSSYFLTYFLAPSRLCEGSKICKLRHEDEMRKEKENGRCRRADSRPWTFLLRPNYGKHTSCKLTCTCWGKWNQINVKK